MSRCYRLGVQYTATVGFFPFLCTMRHVSNNCVVSCAQPSSRTAGHRGTCWSWTRTEVRTPAVPCKGLYQDIVHTGRGCRLAVWCRRRVSYMQRVPFVAQRAAHDVDPQCSGEDLRQEEYIHGSLRPVHARDDVRRNDHPDRASQVCACDTPSNVFRCTTGSNERPNENTLSLQIRNIARSQSNFAQPLSNRCAIGTTRDTHPLS